jgi:hypothetical protein
MRRVVLLLVLLTLLLTACHGSGDHWRRTSGSQTWVYFVMKRSTHPTVYDALARTIPRWSVQSSTVALRLVDSCPSATANCVPIKFTSRNGGSAHRGVTGDGHILTGTSTYIVFDSGPWRQVTAEYVACHEVGHELGADHYPIAGVQGPCDPNTRQPTAHDIDEVTRAHAHID